ncbi:MULTISPECIES: hypothetical protein [unclassified Enterococcus]|uniref:hypothetical protein n=1 Tax=unclassified Enterococcus TaxID=2608891 RepID=UPI001905B5C4|nr:MULTISPECIES: hypothetical protein [unclassified Enterococcus]MBK0038336.1 hypothetical protein [Enterococcus sp. S52]MBK0070968.1 hypothetical protein [Enterococcus sp. S53]MBK0141493.1 hypothetical protein [Enterococcus sp. S76]MBK0144932.1 hypothetical protein [Enterococcus sp. S77]
MKGMSKRMKMNLQFFADPESETTNDEQSQVEESQTENEQESVSEEKETSPKKYSRDDVGKMVAAETKKAVEKAKKEWEKTNSNDAGEESSGQNQNETSAQEKLAQKEAELAKKEIRLEYREKAQEEGLPLKIIDLIDCSDAEKAEASFGLAKEILGENTSKKKKKQFVSGGNPQSGNPDQLDPFLAGLKGK